MYCCLRIVRLFFTYNDVVHVDEYLYSCLNEIVCFYKDIQDHVCRAEICSLLVIVLNIDKESTKINPALLEILEELLNYYKQNKKSNKYCGIFKAYL